MDKQRARQLYELADRLSKLDVNTLSEEQQQQRSTMIAKLKEEARGVKEEFNGEYDDEAGMVQSNLRTMARAVNGLLDTIEDNDNLPEWAQEKLAKAEMMTTSVWDYLLSQKEQGMDPKVQGMAEAKADPTGSWVVYNGSKIVRFKTHSGAKAYAEKNGGTVASSEYYYDKIQKQGVAEGSQRVDSLVTDALKIMRGSDYQVDAVKAIKTVLGEREYNDRRGYYSFYVRQLMDMHGQEGIAETKKPSPKLIAVDIKKTAPVSEEINNEAYERLQKVFAFKNYES